MEKYLMNLDGIAPGDKIQCFNGDRLVIVSFTYDLSNLSYASATLIRRGASEMGNYKPMVNNQILNTKENPNCYKVYEKKLQSL